MTTFTWQETPWQDLCLVGWFVIVHILAVTTLFLARRTYYSPIVMTWVHRGFYGGLVLLGATTMYCVGLGTSAWCFSAATFALTALGGTIDTGNATATF